MSSKRLSEDLRQLVVKKIIKNGGNRELMTVPVGTFTKVSNLLEVTRKTVKRAWVQFCRTGNCKPSGV